jgi:alkylation response protein AidB-like acyl-CoA dehydrogenase
MNLELSEEQKILGESVARFCKTEVSMEMVRRLADHPKGMPDELWQKIAEQAWLGVLIPEPYGGLGLGVTELGIILEEMGRALVPGPYFATAALAAPAIVFGGNEALKSRWLERIAGGEIKATVGILDQDGQLGPDHVKTAAVKNNEGYVLNGKKFFVPDLAAADIAVVAARTGDAEDCVTLFLVETGAPGVSIEENRLTDSTSRSGQLVLKDVQVGHDSVLDTPDQGWEVVDRVLLIANVGIAAGSVAAAERVLRQAVAYARERKQFGVPIGSFQAVKHPLANLFAEIESARSAYHYAAWAVDARSSQARSAVAVARLTGTDAYRKAALISLQTHGGIGFTWEYDLHFHLKRAMHNQYFLGVPADYEQAVAREALGV